MIFETENWIVEARTSRGLSQYKLAELMGIANTTLCSWENNKTTPTNSDRKQILSALKKYDELALNGLLPQKKRYKGRAKLKQPGYLTKSSWDKVSLNYPNSYLKDKSVNDSPITKARGISLFAGCGGMSLGFKWAGVEIVGAVEIEKSAREIYQTNFPRSRILGTDILSLSDSEVEGWKREFGEIDILCGGPPCQGFSLAGKRDQNDYRNRLYREYMRIANIIRPKVLVMENVRVMTSMREKDGSLVTENIIRGFKNIGYDVSFEILNAKDFGVPQSRERVIFIGVDEKLTIKPSFPAATFSEEVSKNELFPMAQVRTFRDACGDLVELESGESCSVDPLHWAIVHPQHVLEWLKITPEGKSAHENDDPKMRPPSGYNTTYKRLKWNEPSSTISTNFNMISGSRNVHPTSTRSLTIREAMRCQSFPDDFKVVGNWAKVRTAIGNAVPPLLAERLAKHILERFLFTT